MLVSVVITLLVVFAIVQVFDLLGNSIAMGRATIEMAGQLRSVSNRLQQDLDNITCPVRPWLDPDAGLGYFEYIEGPYGLPTLNRGSDRDSNADGVDDILEDANSDLIPDETHLGDLDDALMFTARSAGEFFLGRFQGDILESAAAEIIWWVRYNPTTDTRFLHRRVLLVRPDVNSSAGFVLGPLANPLTPNQYAAFLRSNDISVRVVINDSGEAIGLAANSLGDLTSPHHRFGHFPLNTNSNVTVDGSDPFPPVTIADWTYPLDTRYFQHLEPDDPSDLGDPNNYSLTLTGDRQGEDLVLADVLAFDVKAYDQLAEIRESNGVALVPSDPGYAAATTVIGQGAYVDLAFANEIPQNSVGFSGLSRFPVRGGNSPWFVHYDTWTLLFEKDGINQNFNDEVELLVDEGLDGLDNLNPDNLRVGGVDDIEERETSPPYLIPLRGIEVKIRIMEFSTRQVRQVSVVGDFTSQ